MKQKRKSNAGAHGKYCPEIVKEICNHVRNGLSNRDAARLVNIHEATFYSWLEEHTEFTEALKRAETELKESLLKQILETARSKQAGTWQTNAWLLERRWKDEFSLRTELTGKEGKEFTINIVAPYLSTRQKQISNDTKALPEAKTVDL